LETRKTLAAVSTIFNIFISLRGIVAEHAQKFSKAMLIAFYNRISSPQLTMQVHPQHQLNLKKPWTSPKQDLTKSRSMTMRF